MRSLGIGKTASALSVIAALAGCYEISTAVPAITDASRIAAAPLQPGLYCAVNVTFDEAGAIESMDPAEEIAEDCTDVSVSAGRLVAAFEDSDGPGVMAFDVAELTRGARLMQFPVEDDPSSWTLLIATMRDDAVAVLDEPRLTPVIEAAAADAGVALAPTEEEDIGWGADFPEINILSGEPDAVLGFLREAAGFMFDDALRDEALGRELKDDAMYYVRVGTTAEDADLDPAKAREKVEALVQRIERAMALE